MLEFYCYYMEVHWSCFLVFEGSWDQAFLLFLSQNLARKVKLRFYTQDVAHGTYTAHWIFGIQYSFSQQ